jgi:phage shock protein A
MSIKFNITNEDKVRITNLYLNEKTKEENKRFCHKKNIKSLEEQVEQLKNQLNLAENKINQLESSLNK